METLIDSLLHYSRLGRADPALEPVDVQEVVEDVLERLSIGLRERHVEVRIPRRLPVIRWIACGSRRCSRTWSRTR